jgi:hypothetical protein
MKSRGSIAMTMRSASSIARPGAGSLLQRKCACGNGTAAGRECQECLKKKLQRKLIIGAVDDPLELEADRVAEQVTATSADFAISGAPPRVQRVVGSPAGQVGMAPASVDRVLAGTGMPLESRHRLDMERRFGYDFSQVRVHSGAAADQSAQDVNAHAYTVGHNIVFRAGLFAPGTHEGRRLIAHELVHVVQQSGADGAPAGQNEEDHGPARTRLECRRVGHNPSQLVQRQPDKNLEPYQIEGGLYSPQEKQYAVRNPAGLLLTTSVVGRYERTLADRAPWPITVSKNWMRFEAGALGRFVSDYNDFTQYFGEVLHGIGRMRDLLSAGAPEFPTEMTAVQKRALRPTDNTPSTVAKKQTFRDWQKAQADYATTYTTGAGTSRSGLAFDVARTGKEFDLARQEFWQAKGKLSRTIAAAKQLDRPKYEALELKLSDALALLDPYAAAGLLVDKVLDARQARKEYDAKMKAFGDAVKNANDTVKDDFEAFKGAETIYWVKSAEHQRSIGERDRARGESRQRAGLLGQATADPSESRDPVLSEVRMPGLVADAWHALATIGPPSLEKLRAVLAGRSLVERASRTDLSWRGHDPLAFNDITQIRLAWQRAQSWQDVLTREEIEGWVATDKLWQETFTKFNV